MAHKYLSILPSSLPFKWHFSTAGEVMSDLVEDCHGLKVDLRKSKKTSLKTRELKQSEEDETQQKGKR